MLRCSTGLLLLSMEQVTKTLVIVPSAVLLTATCASAPRYLSEERARLKAATILKGDPYGRTDKEAASTPRLLSGLPGSPDFDPQKLIPLDEWQMKHLDFKKLAGDAKAYVVADAKELSLDAFGPPLSLLVPGLMLSWVLRGLAIAAHWQNVVPVPKPQLKKRQEEKHHDLILQETHVRRNVPSKGYGGEGG